MHLLVSPLVPLIFLFLVPCRLAQWTCSGSAPVWLRWCQRGCPWWVKPLGIGWRETVQETPTFGTEIIWKQLNTPFPSRFLLNKAIDFQSPPELGWLRVNQSSINITGSMINDDQSWVILLVFVGPITIYIYTYFWLLKPHFLLNFSTPCTGLLGGSKSSRRSYGGSSRWGAQHG